MRNRLVELLKSAKMQRGMYSPEGYLMGATFNIPLVDEKYVGLLADHLLAEGVIVPTHKIGAKVYIIVSRTSDDKNLYIFEDNITHYRICDSCTIMCLEKNLGVPSWRWNKVFLTREEAEKALAERNKNEE